MEKRIRSEPEGRKRLRPSSKMGSEPNPNVANGLDLQGKKTRSEPEGPKPLEFSYTSGSEANPKVATGLDLSQQRARVELLSDKRMRPVSTSSPEKPTWEL